MSDRIFGEIPGIAEGQTFANRIELSLSLVHRPRQAGISGSQLEGADCIVLSGGYEDDVDYENVIVYTGHGGRDISSGKQVTDQDMIRGNLALALSCQRGLPVRVIRGYTNLSSHAPQEGYRYDGLFRVEEYWKEKGRSGAWFGASD
ncbi:YDG/SRA domain-containing protein [Neolewinella marina]|uniref:YDG/SRA domain-containing protein n=1 Tax=Neolewinella marina TaxID=438751 RepID=UPI001ADDC750